ncbi:MAG: hypothetical protein NTX45_08060 [Proteobacteria bacterium]|nr:hypothetical protein [Pseudomonadota bacterium]
MNSIKPFIIACLVSVLSFALNFGIFVLGYDRLAVPFLLEEQRMANADFIMSIIVGAFALLAILVGFIVYWSFGVNRRQ